MAHTGSWRELQLEYPKKGCIKTGCIVSSTSTKTVPLFYS